MLYLVDDAADYRFLVQQVFKMFLPQYSLRMFAGGLELIQYVEEKSTALPVALTESDLSSPDEIHLDVDHTDVARPNLIVLDVDMPKLNGLQTLDRLKQNPYWRSVPVVLMSNRIDPEFKEIAYQLGAASFLTKPTDLLMLRDVLGQLCREWVVG